jgi:hypothetical protein
MHAFYFFIGSHLLVCWLPKGTTYMDAGATAVDDVDGVITNVTVSGLASIDTLKVCMLPMT